MSRSAKMKATTPPKLMPPFHSTTASGTFPIEHTKEMTRREPDQKKRKGTTQKFALYCVVKATRQQWAFSVNMTALLNFRMARDPRGIWLPTLDAFRNLAA